MRKSRGLFIIFLIAIMMVAVLGACEFEGEVAPIEGHKKITLYFNGGNRGESRSETYVVPDGGRLPTPVNSGSGQSQIYNPSRKNYDFYGWAYLKDEYKHLFKTREQVITDKDKEGNVYEVENVNGEKAVQQIPYIEGHDPLDESKDEKELTISDFERASEDSEEILAPVFWNFDFDVADRDVVLVALWKPQRKYVYVPLENIDDTDQSKNDEDFDGDNINDPGYNKLQLFNVEPNGSILLFDRSSEALPKNPGFQIEGFYSDRNCKYPVYAPNNIYRPEPKEITVNGETKFEVVPIYIKWLQNNYKIISSASDFGGRIVETQSYYISNDLDFAGINFIISPTYRGEIVGKDKVWKNLTLNITQGDEPEYGGLFNRLTGAIIKDVHFENLHITFTRKRVSEMSSVTLGRPVKFYIFCPPNAIDEQTTLENITLGDETSYFTTNNAVYFENYSHIDIDPATGYPYRRNELTTSSDKRVAADENGNYPEEIEYQYGTDNRPVQISDGRKFRVNKISNEKVFADENGVYPAEIPGEIEYKTENDNDNAVITERDNLYRTNIFENKNERVYCDVDGNFPAACVYTRDSDGEFVLIRVNYKGDDGKDLGGYKKEIYPDEASLNIDRIQLDNDNFGITNNENILGCTVNMTQLEQTYDWEFELDPNAPSTNKTEPILNRPDTPVLGRNDYAFEGWFIYDAQTDEITPFDFSYVPEEKVVLIALWERK